MAPAAHKGCSVQTDATLVDRSARSCHYLVPCWRPQPSHKSYTPGRHPVGVPVTPSAKPRRHDIKICREYCWAATRLLFVLLLRLVFRHAHRPPCSPPRPRAHRAGKRRGRRELLVAVWVRAQRRLLQSCPGR